MKYKELAINFDERKNEIKRKVKDLNLDCNWYTSKL